MLKDLEELIAAESSLFENFEYKVRFDYFDLEFTTKDKFCNGKPLVIETRAYFNEIKNIPDLAQVIYERAQKELRDMLD